MVALSAFQLPSQGALLITSSRTASQSVRGQRCKPPRLAAWHVASDTLVVKALGPSSPLAGEGPEQEPLDWQAVVNARSERVDQLALPLLSEEAAPAPVAGLQRLARIVSESFLVARLAVKLFGYVGFGWRWICAFLQLLAYAALLMPGFLQMVAFYCFSSRVVKSVRYGPRSRNVLDLYLPPNHWGMSGGLRPVVIYVTGGAWTIGYKAWGALLSRRLSKAGVIVACLDYRNFPQATAIEMMEDINHGISWVLKKIVHHGGDPNQVYICGQSCGGHLASMAVLSQAEQQALGQPVPGGSPAWDVTRIKALVGISGVYNAADLVDHFDRRGLYNDLFCKIMSIGGKPHLKLLSPVYVVAHSLQLRRGESVEEGSEMEEDAAAGQRGSCRGGRGTPVVQAASGRCNGEGGLGVGEGASSEELSEAEEGALLPAVGAGKENWGSPQQSPILHAQSAQVLHGNAGADSKRPVMAAVGRHNQAPLLGSSASSLIGAAWPGSDAGERAASNALLLSPSTAAAAAAMAAAAAPEIEGVMAGSRVGLGRTPAELMPHVLLLHGDADTCAPVEGAEQFADALREAGVSVELKRYKGQTHTSPLLENPMRGGQDTLTNDILSLVLARPVSYSYPTLCPHFLIKLAAKVCPF